VLIKFLNGSTREVTNLRSADLSGADLYRANLRSANLRSADLRGANLNSANLSGANLRDANLSGANLSFADLYGANLSFANLSGANLSFADLYGANLSFANLRRANLRRANLYGANLSDANLRDAKGLAGFVVAPQVGAVTGFKKVGSAIVTLLIPADAKRVNAYGSRKCRAEFAYVLKVEGKGHLKAYEGFVYPRAGLVTPDSYDPDARVECSHGIHFFITREEAEEFQL
jgi:uncharacterized protein YjbI with pentapeptide repeats